MKIIKIEIFADEDQGVVTYENGLEEMIESVKQNDNICDCCFNSSDNECKLNECKFNDSLNDFKPTKCSFFRRLDKTNINWKVIV